MNKPDQFARACRPGGSVCGLSASDGIDGGFVVEAVEIATGLLELPDPFMRLRNRRALASEIEPGDHRAGSEHKSRNTKRNEPIPGVTTYLRNHHMAVKGSCAVGLSRPGNMRADLRNDGGAKGDIGDEVAIHDVDMEPVRALVHLGRAFMAERAEVGAEDGGGYNGRGAHFVYWSGRTRNTRRPRIEERPRRASKQQQ